MSKRIFWLVVLALFVVVGVAQAARRNEGTTYFNTIQVNNLRNTVYASTYAAGADITKAQVQSAGFFGVNTNGAAVDLDIGNDAAMDAADVGTEKVFAVTTGHATQALTVTAGASGITTVTTINAVGSTCEDVGDFIKCLITSTATATCITYCAD